MDLICQLAGNKNVIRKFELVEKLKRNNKELAQSSYQLSLNCNDHFNVLLSAFQHFSVSFRADSIEQFTTFERQIFRCLLAGFGSVPC